MQTDSASIAHFRSKRIWPELGGENELGVQARLLPEVFGHHRHATASISTILNSNAIRVRSRHSKDQSKCTLYTYIQVRLVLNLLN
jgi:hypothetical protein